jgi:hypothetical protein
VVAAVVAVGVALPGAALAAEQSVADIREELTVLSRQVQEIRRRWSPPARRAACRRTRPPPSSASTSSRTCSGV